MERFVQKMEEKQDEAIDAVLDLTGDSEECTVALGEEVCWGCDANVTYSGEGCPQPCEAPGSSREDSTPHFTDTKGGHSEE